MTEVQKLAKVMVLKDMCKEYELLAKYNGGVDYDRWKALEMLIKALSQEPKWIPVSERLPYNHEYIKNNGLFNVSDGNRSYSEWFDIYDTQKFGEPTMSGFRVDYAVTAWMPLPTPYEPQESEDIGDYPDTIHNQFDNMTGSMNL